MATKKTDETVTETEAMPADEWAEEVEMIIPRKGKGEGDQYYVCVNDRRFAFPANGKKQKLPKPVAEILQSSLDAEYAADDFADEMNRKAAEAARGM